MAPSAPVRRQVSNSGGVNKRVHRKPRTNKEPSDSWELLDRQGLHPSAMGSNHVRELLSPGDADTESNAADVEETVAPLREMADKLGREVELFAETLDKFISENLPTAASTFDAVHDLVSQFKEIADETVTDLKRKHDRAMREELRKEWNEQAKISSASAALARTSLSASTSVNPRTAEHVKQLRAWQQEADLWELFRIMLELHPFEADATSLRTEREEKLAKLGPPHRYMSEGDLWERFILEDDLARERSLIKSWLENTVDHQTSDIEAIVEELEVKAGRGKGLWSAGWLHTRERIKGEKRLRSWPNAADSPLPQVKRSANNEMLVTTLDPDAPARQQRTLEKPDAFFERAIWVACWEMLRRGVTVQDVCEWCEERKEGWRAAALGMGLDNTEPNVSSAAWRHMCYLASQSGSADYEAAVYGILGGSVKAVEKVCKTIDDHLYAYYSAMLLCQFDQYVLSVCPTKALPESWSRRGVDESMLDPARAEVEISNLIHKLRMRSSTSAESGQPMKVIQSFLLADQVGSLIHTVGVAIAETASLQGPEDMIFIGNRQALVDGEQRPEAEVALDQQTLRMAAHMSILYRILSPEHLEGEELDEDENVLVAYIQALREAGKRTIIPIYASKLQRARYIVVMGRVLQDITESKEQNEMLKLLEGFDMDVVAILTEQLAWITERYLLGQHQKKPLRILEDVDNSYQWPRQRINIDFLAEDFTVQDEAVVRCLQWFKLLHGGWQVTFEALTLALRKCLVTGRITCAQAIVQQFPYEEISKQKSRDTIRRHIHMMDTTAEPEDEVEAMAWEIMKRQSRTYFELEQLVHAIESLSAWRTEEQKYVGIPKKPRGVPQPLKKLKDALTLDMEPILEGILLHPVNEEEAEDLAHIRVTYLPEIIIAYNTVLHSAGSMITRSALLESMELSVVVAGSDDGPGTGESQSNGLAECFVQAGRMRELVKSFALTSRLMLILKATGRAWKQGKDREGRDLGMWEIGKAMGKAGAHIEEEET